MFRDEIRKEVHDRLREHDLNVVADKLTPEVFSEAARRTNLRIATCPLNLVNLVWLGIATARHKTQSFGSILTVTLKLLQDQEHFGQSQLGKELRRKQRSAKHSSRQGRKKHDPRGLDPTQVSEEAFVKARRHMPMQFWLALILLLGERFEAEHGEHLRS